MSVRARRGRIVGPMLWAVFAGVPVASADERVSDPLAEVVIVGPLETPSEASGESLDGARLRGGAAGLGEALGRTARGAFLNDASGNPYQPDLSLHGFTASPVLGTPQGLAVALDGVRMNEPFGDAVYWDLFPTAAIDTVTVRSGAQTLAGLNALGGAVFVRTRRGSDATPLEIEAGLGSFGRRSLTVTDGGVTHGTDVYAALTVEDDEGWARHNASAVRQGFVKFGRRGDAIDTTLSLTLAEATLGANQAVPESTVAQAADGYTYPDATTDRLAAATLSLNDATSAHSRVTLTLDARRVRSDTYNSNVNLDFDPTLSAAGANAPTSNVLGFLGEHHEGAGVEWVYADPTRRLVHAVVGVSLDRGRSDYTSETQPAGFGPDTHSDAVPIPTVGLATSVASEALYGAVAARLTEAWTVEAGARAEQARETLADRLGTALNGSHAAARLSPAVALAWRSGPLQGGVRYAEALRLPSPMEYACADPAAPCSLPNAFAADPALAPVRARSLEFTLAAAANGRTAEVTVFRHELSDDLAWVAASGSGSSGYFANRGRTRREGVDVSAQFEAAFLRVSGSLTYLSATERSTLRWSSPYNSTAVDGSILVRAGDRLVLSPRWLGKTRVEADVGRASIDLDVSAASSMLPRGDENGLDAHGVLPGSLRVDAGLRYRLGTATTLELRIANLLDRRDASFGVLGENVYTGPGRSFDRTTAAWRTEPFVSVTAPRTLWLMARCRSR